MTSSVALLLVVLGAASALPRPQQFRQTVPVTFTKTYQSDDVGQFSSSISQSDGQQHIQTGQLKQTPDGKDYVLVLKGGYSYTSPEGLPVRVEYNADENGFVATGNVIPEVVQPEGFARGSQTGLPEGLRLPVERF